MDKYIRNLIERLCEYYNYRITEINGNEKEFWGAIKTEIIPKKLFVFSSWKDLNSMNEAVKSNIKLETDYINVIKVIVVKNNTDISNIVNSNLGNILVINASTNQVLYASRESSEEVTEIVNTIGSINNNRVQHNKYIVTYAIIAINIVVYVISAILSSNFFDIDIRVLDFLGAKDNTLINSGEYYRLFTCMFLHSGIVHIASNMYSLYSIGGLVESIFGRKKYIIMYLLSGLIASLFSYVFSSGISVGASGAIFGVLGGVLVISHKLKHRIGKGLFRNIIFVIAINLFISFTIPNIDISAHLGGLISGIIISWFIFPKEMELE
ncbi:rhomboid family intramembrane serine protease [Clostridium arbusti]|uniref:rhomboid family intramembrane serine protease n=1 Tax=Clostridium arbusti TaxID=1137848 RepID=UPI000289FDFD|nr:rhomboid family intramembrane serine protease [Clostridium arbusti]